MIDLILIILLIAIVAWREVQILIDRGSWNDWDYHNLYWYIDQNSKEKILWVIPLKNLDSFHVSNGLFTLVLIYILYMNRNIPELIYLWQNWLTSAVHICFYWLIWMQIRNLFMKLQKR